MSSEYEKLLDDVYEKLPEKTTHTERFEIPKFEFFIEGNRTIVKNFKVVCDKLRREPQTVMKYLTKELAVPAEIQGERLILQRKLMGDILNRKLWDFVNSFVICNECKRPDTHIEDAGRGVRMLVCESCGAKRTIRD
jgi:translation initiation factor 2 subunit 2